MEASSSLPSLHSLDPLHIPYNEMHWSTPGHLVCTPPKKKTVKQVYNYKGIP